MWKYLRVGVAAALLLACGVAAAVAGTPAGFCARNPAHWKCAATTTTATSTTAPTSTTTTPTTTTTAGWDPSMIPPPQAPLADWNGGGTKSTDWFSYSTTGGIVSHLNAHDYTGYGVGVMAWPPADSTSPVDYHDLLVTNTGHEPPTSNGTAEANFWLGQTGRYYRLEGHNGTWMGMWTGARVKGSTVEDFRLLDQPRVGLYVEHATEWVTFRRFQITSTGNAVNVEWWYRDPTYAPFMPAGVIPGTAGSHDLVFEDFDITVRGNGGWGFFIDAGNYNIVIRDGRIRCAPGVTCNGIAYPAQLANPDGAGGDVTIDWATVDMSGVTGTRRWRHNNPIG